MEAAKAPRLDVRRALVLRLVVTPRAVVVQSAAEASDDGVPVFDEGHAGGAHRCDGGGVLVLDVVLRGPGRIAPARAAPRIQRERV